MPKIDNNNSQTNTIIGPNTTVNGNMEVSGSLLVYGTVIGDIRTNGSVRTAKDSFIQGKVHAQEAVIDGKLEGTLNTKGRSTLGGTATLTGEVTVELLVIEEGARFSGNCKMSGIETSSNGKAGKQKQMPISNDHEEAASDSTS